MNISKKQLNAKLATTASTVAFGITALGSLRTSCERVQADKMFDRLYTVVSGKPIKKEVLGSMLVVLWVKQNFGCVVPKKVMALK